MSRETSLNPFSALVFQIGLIFFVCVLISFLYIFFSSLPDSSSLIFSSFIFCCYRCPPPPLPLFSSQFFHSFPLSHLHLLPFPLHSPLFSTSVFSFLCPFLCFFISSPILPPVFLLYLLSCFLLLFFTPHLPPPSPLLFPLFMALFAHSFFLLLHSILFRQPPSLPPLFPLSLSHVPSASPSFFSLPLFHSASFIMFSSDFCGHL